MSEVQTFPTPPEASASTIEPLLLDAAGVCRLLSLAPRSFNRLRSRGVLPQPVKMMAKRNYWKREDIVAFVDSLGCGCIGQ